MKKVLSFLLSAVMLLSITSGLDFSLIAGSYENNESSIDDSALVMNDTTDTTLSDEDGTGAPQGYASSAGNSATVHFEGARVFSSAQAASNATVSGSCGDNLTWSLSTDGELVISGNGKMDAFSSYTSVPWYNYISSVETVRINSGVTSISDYAFYNARYLTNVTIPSTVTEIGRMAFAMCSSLTSITLPSSVKEISYALFGDCTKLSSITATGITAIGDYAFQSTALTTFKVGKDVSGISNLAFFKMSKLASFTVDSSNKTFSVSNGILYTDSGKTLFAYPAGKTASAFTIPSTVTKIAKCAFTYATNLKTVTIPTSVTTLDESAFQGCGITSVKIPDSVTTVGNFTFYQSDVRTVTFGTGIKETSYEMFEKCGNLTTINFPNTELALYSRTFAYCSSLETVNLPATVTSIGNGCFGECTALTSVTTNGLKSIPFQAFLNCTSLTSLNLNNIENIYRAAFYGCRKLAKVTLPATTQYVHNIAFMQTTELTCKNPDLSKFGYNGLARLSDISITGSESYTQAYKVLELVNSRRAEAGVGKLVMDESLLDSAMQRAAETAVCFAHTRPDGSTVFEMNSKINGENIAAGQTSAADVMTSWMNSQGHRENILNEDYKTIGIGCFKINGIYFWVQVFGTDANAAEVSKPSDKKVSKTVTVAIDEFSEGTISTGTIFGSVETYEIKFAVDLTSSSIKPSGTSQASVSLINPGFNCKIKVDNTGCQWSSSNTRVATVNKNGLVTGVGHGNSNINLKLGLIAQSKVITVTGSHDYGNGTVTKPATTSSAGTITYTCSCGDKKTETIAKISSAKLSKTSYTYDGNEKNPTVTVKDTNGKTLVNGTDYTVTYDEDRTNVGTYNVTVNYKGKYSGTTKLSFTVIQQIPERCTPNLSETTYKYDGSEKTPTVTIVDVVNNVLKEGTDYTLTYDDGRTEPGTYNVKITYKGNYSGTDTLSFDIVDKSSASLTATLSKESYTYDGNEKNPTVTVKDSQGNTLVKGTDYTVTYDDDRTNVGTYNVTVTYIGEYTGTDVLSFKVIPQIPERCTPVLSKTSYTYDGNEKNPTVTIKDVVNNVLVNGIDYTLTYDADRTNVGTYNVTITYKGNYSGTDTVSFKVIEQIPERCTPNLSETTYKYDGSEKTPTVTIIDVVNNVLEEGRDYTLTYDEGRTEPGTYNVKITYKGNYSGTATLSFYIVDTSSASLTATLSKTSYTYDGNEKNPTVTVKDSSGKTLVKGTDYTVTYDAGRTNVGTYNVKVTYIGKYSGTATLSFKVIQQIPSRCTATLSATQTYYTGTVKTPGVSIKDVVGNVLKNGTDYTVTMDSGRKNVGRYAVVINYKGNYSGSQTLYFNIIPKGITGITKITSKSKGFTVQWATQQTATTGYQVQYSTSSSFSNATTITMPKNVYYAKSVTGLTGNKKYYVRIRTYTQTKFNGSNYNIYSPWCAVKSVVTGK